MADLILKEKGCDMLPYMDARLKNYPREQRCRRPVSSRETS